MVDEARTAWKHSIIKQTKAMETKFPSLYNKVPPSWNPGSYRRSITLRSFRMWCEAMVAVRHPENKRSETMKRRFAMMQSWPAYGREYGGKCYTASEKEKVKKAQKETVKSMEHDFKRWETMRFSDDLVNYPRSQYYKWGNGGRKLCE